MELSFILLWAGLVMGAICVVLTLELARRATGWGLVAVCGLALLYAYAGPYLPGFLAHRGYDTIRLIEQLYLSTEGIWGIPLGVSANFVYLFVLFGAVLDTAGGGALLIALANKVATAAVFAGPPRVRPATLFAKAMSSAPPPAVSSTAPKSTKR